MRFMKALVAAALLVLAASACGHAKSVIAKAGCSVQIAKWYEHKGGMGDIHAVRVSAVSALKAAHKVEANHADKAAVADAQDSVLKLESAVTALRGNLPPDCAHGVNAPVGMGLMDYNAAAKAEGRLVKAAQKQDSNGVQSALKSMQDDAHTGNVQFKAALKAAIRYARS